MLHCPTDHVLLRRARAGGAFAWVCDQCNGRAVTMPALRRHLEPAVANQLWRLSIQSRTAGVPCPICRRATVRIGLSLAREQLDLDICRRCHCVWFDNGEFARLPAAPPPAAVDDGLSTAQRQQLAIAEVKHLAASARREADDLPSLQLSRLPAILGMPVELAATDSSVRPWFTWLTTALVAVVSIAGFVWPEVVTALQMVPGRLGDSAGLTMFTAFFVHGGWGHLLSNLWFLFVFGDNTEQILGRAGWLLLLVGATFLGAVAQILFDPRSDMPCVGASGGISGLMVCYALFLPRARLGTFLWIWFRPVWVTFSARTAFFVWMAMQAWLLSQQLGGFGNISALAHLGGVAAGLLVWLAMRDRSPE